MIGEYWYELVGRVQTGVPDGRSAVSPIGRPAPPDFLRELICRDPGPRQVLDAASLLWNAVAAPLPGCAPDSSTLTPPLRQGQEGPEEFLCAILNDAAARYWPEKREHLLREYLALCESNNLRIPDWHLPDIPAHLPPSPAAPQAPPTLQKLLVRLARRAIHLDEGSLTASVRPLEPEWYQGHVPNSLLQDPPPELGKLAKTHRQTLAILAQVPAEQWFPPQLVRRVNFPDDDLPLIWALGRSTRSYGPGALLSPLLELAQSASPALELLHQTGAFKGFAARPLTSQQVAILKIYFTACTTWSPSSPAHEILSHLAPLPASLLKPTLRALAWDLGRHGSLPLGELMERCALHADLPQAAKLRLPACPTTGRREFAYHQAAHSAWEAANSLLSFRIQMTDAFRQRRVQGVRLA